MLFRVILEMLGKKKKYKKFPVLNQLNLNLFFATDMSVFSSLKKVSLDKSQNLYMEKKTNLFIRTSTSIDCAISVLYYHV